MIWHNKALLAIVLILFFLPSTLTAKVYLVSIGIADYPGAEYDLYTPVNDAQIITWLYAKNSEVTYCQLLNANATVANITAAMKIFTLADYDDIVVLYYSGHGYSGGIMVYDGSLSYDEIRRFMSKSKCKNKMIFADACFSGGVVPLRQSQKHESERANKANIMLFLSSRYNEFSWERSDMKNAYFTYLLQKGLRGNADANRDRIITAKELFTYVHKNMFIATNGQQHPVMWGNFSDAMPVMKW